MLILSYNVSMIQAIAIKNYCSIVDATVRLSPFTLLIGANGTGKTNFLRLLRRLSSLSKNKNTISEPHINYPNRNQKDDVAHEILGDPQTDWSIAGAIAIPVEMLESWLLLICEQEQPLPMFAEQVVTW